GHRAAGDVSNQVVGVVDHVIAEDVQDAGVAVLAGYEVAGGVVVGDGGAVVTQRWRGVSRPAREAEELGRGPPLQVATEGGRGRRIIGGVAGKDCGVLVQTGGGVVDAAPDVQLIVDAHAGRAGHQILGRVREGNRDAVAADGNGAGEAGGRLR